MAALVRSVGDALTWRDVKLILAASARKVDASNRGWLDGAGRYGASGNYEFNHGYGFGLVDAAAAVELAKGWKNLPPFIEASSTTAGPGTIEDATAGYEGDTLASTVEVGGEVEFVEFVEVDASFVSESFRDYEVELVSPAGRVSVLYRSGTRYPWSGPITFGSARHLGENPEGTWALRVTDDVEGSAPGLLESWSLKVYGFWWRPGLPAITSIGHRSTALIVGWTAPAEVGASEITSWDVRRIRSDAADKSDENWTLVEVADPATTSVVLSGLELATRYDIQVRASNDEGDGPWSAARMETTSASAIIVTPTSLRVTEGRRAPTR